jgi:EF-P beta-lysylation protein EpmB
MSWQQIQQQNFRCIKKLARFLEIDENSFLIDRNPRFPLNLPLRLAKKIDTNRLDDPILLQFLPLQKEGDSVAGFETDPLGEQLVKQSGKLLQKYSHRALLLLTSSCVMNCRFCFRQTFDYEVKNKTFEKELSLIEQNTTCSEIILSGGDPLSLPNAKLQTVITSLQQIPHLKRVRFHTRFPIGIPERIDAGFIELLKQTKLQIFFVIHCNHPAELDSDIFNALKQIQLLGIPILLQTVLLRHINDTKETLQELFEKCIDHAIIPYYLHQLDKTKGTAHFEVEEATGRKIIEELYAVLPGYAVPKYARETRGCLSKTVLC